MRLTTFYPEPLLNEIAPLAVNDPPAGLVTAGGFLIQRPKTRLGLPIFTLATDRAPESCIVIVVK
jgi:hypothetical protein